MGGTNTSFYTGNVDFVDLPAGTQGGFWMLPVKCESSASLSIRLLISAQL